MTPPKPLKSPILCVDLGTTNTRLWRIARDGSITARLTAQVGVRDSARDGNTQKLRQTLRGLILEARQNETEPSACVIAAGMITSALGLIDVPHVPAPAGQSELAAATQRHGFPDVTDLPVLLVPGICTGARPNAADAPSPDGDIMRGEETLCVGLQAIGLVTGKATILNLGSHWKAIQIDAAGRIASSVTSLSGEMIHTISENTILAGSLPEERPQSFDREWVAAGMKEERTTDLARALFRVRLLQLAGRTTPQQRMAYLIGAFIAGDLDSLRKTGKIGPSLPVVLVGNEGLAAAWQAGLAESSITATVLQAETVEKAMLAGLTSILAAT